MGNILKNGVPVVIAGKPNVGKSTLLNSLLNEERAIVSDIAGTTRDTIEEELNVDGIRFRFIDTAGIRKTDDAVESIGVKEHMLKQVKQKLFYISLTQWSHHRQICKMKFHNCNLNLNFPARI